jgi:Domain of unknown function (DUF4185)
VTETAKLAALLAWPFLLLLGSCPIQAADSVAPAPVVRAGATEKICQLTGDVDWESGEPTAAKTFSNFGLDAVDLGYPVETGDKLILLFGDSWPPPHGGGAKGEIPPDDAVGEVVQKDPPNKDGGCLGLQVHSRHDPTPKFVPATIVGAVAVKQGFFNVPTGGVIANDRLFAFFWTDHCSAPSHLLPAPNDPLVRPAASQECPETDDRNSVGRGVLAHSADDGRTFTDVVPMPAGFVYPIAINATLQGDLPQDQRLGIFIFGVARYRASVPYLAFSPVASLADPGTWRFYAGRAPDGSPKWVTRDEWDQKTGNSLAWKPPGDSEVFIPAAGAGRCVGEYSVTWNRPLHMWLMLYNCRGEIAARVAPAPWGPWSAPTIILGNADGVACRLVMTPDGCGERRDYWPGRHVNGKFVKGTFYAPFVLDRYTIAADQPGGRAATIYWLVSTWNPYEVSVMRTTLKSASP